MTGALLTYLVVVAGVLGLVIGSHLNVVIHRVPAGKSTVSPPSACPACQAPIRWFDNVPVAAWVWLRGRCRDCREPISARYPLVEALTAVVFATLTWWALSATGPGAWALPAYIYLAGLGVALTFIDLDTHRLPDRLVLPSYAVLAVLLTVASAGTGQWDALARAGIGALALSGAYLAVAIIYPGGMGMGDVKLAVTLGGALAWLGWGSFAVGAFVPFVIGGAVGIALMSTGRARAGDGVPFGPFMVAGTLVGVVAGQLAWDGYLALSGIA